ncbi:MAG: cytochrome c peroxidase [Saprospiraceae bacterium]
MNNKIIKFSFAFVIILLFGCEKENNSTNDLLQYPYAPQAYSLNIPDHFPKMDIPSDNPLTKEGVELGRHLFYDPILSADSSMSCGSCHIQSKNFTDGLAVSTGIDGIAGRRSSMSLINIGFVKSGYFWDGRSSNLEDQALIPVEDPIELHHHWPNVVAKLQSHDTYPKMFREAFGISSKQEITKILAAKAIAQFERTLISKDSKFDKWQQGEVILNDLELIGQGIFFDDDPDLPDGECGHCHNTPLAFTDDYFNNGLSAATSLLDFTDKGRGAHTGQLNDNGKFRAPTLRNIMYSAPYMHDGSLLTFEDVLTHYNSGGKTSPYKDKVLHNLQLDEFYLQCLTAFIKTFEDTVFLNNPEYKNPFE